MADPKADRDFVAEYEELTKDAFLDKGPIPGTEEDAVVEKFLERVLGPEMKAIMDRGPLSAGLWFDEDGEPIEE